MKGSLVAAGHSPSGPQDCFFAPRFTSADATHQRRTCAIHFGQAKFSVERRAQV